MSLINKKVEVDIKKDGKFIYKGEVLIIDKVLTSWAQYIKSPLINNASMEVYIGVRDRVYESFGVTVTKKEIVAFQYSDIVEIL
jgi:hypothetical protein